MPVTITPMGEEAAAATTNVDGLPTGAVANADGVLDLSATLIAPKGKVTIAKHIPDEIDAMLDLTKPVPPGLPPGARHTPFDVDIMSLESGGWRNPNLDASQYFNYGFNEQTWAEYCMRQRAYRWRLYDKEAAKVCLLPVSSAFV